MQSCGSSAKKENVNILQKLGTQTRPSMKQGSERVMLASVLLEREEIVSAVWEAIWLYLPELNICFPYVSTAPRIHPGEKLLHMCPGKNVV